MAMVVKQFEIYLLNLDPMIGSEIQKTRPCLVISPDEMNRHINTVIIAPMTTKGRACPTRVTCQFQRKQGQIVLDQIRTIDKAKLIEKMGTLDAKTQANVLTILAEMFSS